jgi:hypothetical protein
LNLEEREKGNGRAVGDTTAAEYWEFELFLLFLASGVGGPRAGEDALSTRDVMRESGSIRPN